MEVVQQLIILRRLFSYGLLGEIAIAIGLIIIFFYQRYKIDSLETQIKSQKGILDSAETFFELFDLEKLKGYAEIREEKMRTEKEIEFKKIRADLEETVRKRENTSKFLLGEYISVSNAFLDAFFKLPSILRREVISRMGEGVLKRKMEETNKELEESENSTGVNALTLALKVGRKEKGR